MPSQNESPAPPAPPIDDTTPAFEDAASLKQLAYVIAYGGKLDNAFRGTTRVVLIAKTIHELRVAINDRDHVIRTLQAEAKNTPDNNASRGCTMMARIESGHGKDGYCAIRNAACPRECLLKQIDAHRMNTEARERDIEMLVKDRNVDRALLKLYKESGMPSQDGEPIFVEQVHGRLDRQAVREYTDKVIADATADNDATPVEISAAYDTALAVQREIEAFVRWVLTGRKKNEDD
jgi:hypothetical protein